MTVVSAILEENYILASHASQKNPSLISRLVTFFAMTF